MVATAAAPEWLPKCPGCLDRFKSSENGSLFIFKHMYGANIYAETTGISWQLSDATRTEPRRGQKIEQEKVAQVKARTDRRWMWGEKLKFIFTQPINFWLFGLLPLLYELVLM